MQCSMLFSATIDTTMKTPRNIVQTEHKGKLA